MHTVVLEDSGLPTLVDKLKDIKADMAILCAANYKSPKLASIGRKGIKE